MTQAPPNPPVCPLRVIIQQTALPKYRIPVFRELARRPGIDLTVTYTNQKELPNAEPDGFKAIMCPEWHISVRRRQLSWSVAQSLYADPRRTDVLVLSWSLNYLNLFPTLLKARFRKLPTVLWGHGYSKREGKWRRRLREGVARYADAVVLYNHTTAERLIADGWLREKVYVALNALDQDPIQQARQHWLSRPQDLAEFQRNNNLDPAATILFVSRLDPANRLDLLLHAVKRMAFDRPSLHVIIVGKGEPHGSELRALARRLHIEKHIVFTGAVYNELDLAPWFLSSRVFCYPANIGLSILHAFGYGLPVITNDAFATQNPEIEALHHNENGLLYHQDNIDDLVWKLSQILDDTSLAQRLGAKARDTALRQFTVKNMADGMEAAIRYAAGLRTPHP